MVNQIADVCRRGIVHLMINTANNGHLRLWADEPPWISAVGRSDSLHDQQVR